MQSGARTGFSRAGLTGRRGQPLQPWYRTRKFYLRVAVALLLACNLGSLWVLSGAPRWWAGHALEVRAQDALDRVCGKGRAHIRVVNRGEWLVCTASVPPAQHSQAQALLQSLLGIDERRGDELRLVSVSAPAERFLPTRTWFALAAAVLAAGWLLVARGSFGRDLWHRHTPPVWEVDQTGSRPLPRTRPEKLADAGDQTALLALSGALAWLLEVPCPWLVPLLLALTLAAPRLRDAWRAHRSRPRPDPVEQAFRAAVASSQGSGPVLELGSAWRTLANPRRSRRFWQSVAAWRQRWAHDRAVLVPELRLGFHPLAQGWALTLHGQPLAGGVAGTPDELQAALAEALEQHLHCFVDAAATHRFLELRRAVSADQVAALGKLLPLRDLTTTLQGLVRGGGSLRGSTDLVERLLELARFESDPGRLAEALLAAPRSKRS